MGVFGSFKKLLFTESKQPQQSASGKPEGKTHKHNIAGVEHYESNLMKLSHKNSAFSLSEKEIIARRLFNQNIYEYSFAPQKTELLPDPTNPHDPNAIKVLIDGEHVGYIKAGSCNAILKLLNEDRIQYIKCEISGGAFKNLWCDGKDIQQREKGRKKFMIQIYITEK